MQLAAGSDYQGVAEACWTPPGPSRVYPPPAYLFDSRGNEASLLFIKLREEASREVSWSTDWQH